MNTSIKKWPKVFPELTAEQQAISNDFMKHWHELLSSRSQYGLLEKFNHNYVTQKIPADFISTLEIGAGLGEHLNYENLTQDQKKNYVALEMRENMAEKIKQSFPEIQTLVGDCQARLPFADNHFDRIIAIHVLEHLPNLPNAIKEMYRLCHKQHGIFSIVIPCEGGFAYSTGRKLTAERIFEKRYKQPYKWFIEREHINQPHEIFAELAPYFEIVHKSFFPLKLPIIHLNLCIGITLKPRETHHDTN